MTRRGAALVLASLCVATLANVVVVSRCSEKRRHAEAEPRIPSAEGVRAHRQSVDADLTAVGASGAARESLANNVVPGVESGRSAIEEARLHADGRPAIDVYVEDLDRQTAIAKAEISCSGRSQGVTDGSGRLRVYLDPGRKSSIVASARGYANSGRRVAAEANEEKTLVLSMVKEATVFGFVRDPRGLPIEGAEVSLGVHRDRDRPILVAEVISRKPDTAFTDERGFFAFGELGSSRGELLVQVIARHPGLAEYQSAKERVQNSTNHGPIVCSMTEGGGLSGTVTANGLPREGVIRLTAEGSRARTVVAGGNGEYRVDELSLGSWQLSASLAEHGGVTAVIDVHVGSANDRQDVALDYDMELISGQVTMQSGLPVEGAEVVCELREWSDINRPTYVGRTRADGSFEVQVPVQRGAPSKEYTVRLARWEEDCAGTSVFPPGRVVLACADSVSVRFALVSSSGSPLEQVWASWLAVERLGEEEVVVSIERLEEGSFRMLLPTGTGLLSIGADGHSPYRRELSVPTAGTFGLGTIELPTWP
jgi:hypothetical protein